MKKLIKVFLLSFLVVGCLDNDKLIQPNVGSQSVGFDLDAKKTPTSSTFTITSISLDGYTFTFNIDQSQSRGIGYMVFQIYSCGGDVLTKNNVIQAYLNGVNYIDSIGNRTRDCNFPGSYIKMGAFPTDDIITVELTLDTQSSGGAFLIKSGTECLKMNDPYYTFTYNLCPAKDLDGNTYDVVKIGADVWMTENLKTSTFANGDPIPNVTGNYEWSSLTTGAWSYYNNNAAFDLDYGKLYNYFAVADTRNVCPDGWHAATNDEWIALANYLGGESTAGGALKEDGNAHWYYPNTGGTNSSGFNALPGGNRYSGGVVYPNSGNFYMMGSRAHYWTSTPHSSMQNISLYWFLDYNNASLKSNLVNNEFGFSVRCVKD